MNLFICTDFVGMLKNNMVKFSHENLRLALFHGNFHSILHTISSKLPQTFPWDLTYILISWECARNLRTICIFPSPVLNSLHQQLYYLVLYDHFCSGVLMKTHISFKSSSKLRTICLFSFSSPKRYSSTATTAVFFRTIWPFLPCSPNRWSGNKVKGQYAVVIKSMLLATCLRRARLHLCNIYLTRDVQITWRGSFEPSEMSYTVVRINSGAFFI